jgi:hypothetical protein
MNHFDKAGQPIDIRQFARLAQNKDYRRIGWDLLPDGRVLSTVWLGINHQYGEGLPLIFETLLFAKEGKWEALECQRYATEAEARAGHRAMLERLLVQPQAEAP